MTACKENVEVARQACKSYGLQLTEKRTSLFGLLMQQKKAITAYELADEYQAAYQQPVAIITVYRVLKALQDKGLVHKLNTINRFVACKNIDAAKPHEASQFLICKNCNSVEELSLDRALVKELKKGIRQTDFVFKQLQLEMNCRCKLCQAPGIGQV